MVCSFTRRLLSSPMATSSLRFAFSPLIHSQNSSRLLFSIPNYQTKSIRILGFSTSSPLPDTTLETLAPPPPPSHSVNNLNPYKWEPYRKKKVVMRVGYVGTDYRGNNIQFTFTLDFDFPVSVSLLSLDSIARFFNGGKCMCGFLLVGILFLVPYI